MNVKIQSKGIAGGQNTGSCIGYVNYLEHENREKVKSGMSDSTIPFFDYNGWPTDKARLVKSIDSNTGQLHREDAKFYSLILSFSDEEVRAMGGSREEILSGVHMVMEGMMDLYASNFKCNDIISHQDLKYYYTIHEYREGFTPGLHVHVIVSRKDAANLRKLSPMTNHRRASSGVIRRGFDRDSFYRSCERLFDHTFGFDRTLDRSYDYFNTMKHGSVEQREVMIREVVRGSDVIKEINAAIAKLVEQLANESHVPDSQKEYMRQIHAIPAERRNMNAFWNTYHSHYSPLLSSVRSSCNHAFYLYSKAKDDYGICSKRMSEKYKRLRTVTSEIDRLQDKIYRARSSKVCIKLFSLLIAAVNPVPALVVALVGCILAESQKQASIDQIRVLRKHVKEVRSEIETLHKKQQGLKQVKADTLKEYIEVKDERQELKAEVDALREMLENAPIISEETLKGLGERIREGGFIISVNASRENAPTDFGASLYEAFMNSDDRLSLDLTLLARNLTYVPVFHSNGGVADFTVAYKGTEHYASDIFTAERLTYMLDKWESMTGQVPAYKIKNEMEARERTSQTQREEVQQTSQPRIQQSSETNQIKTKLRR